MTDSEDGNDISPTNLDLIRLKDIEVGESVLAECKKWSVFRYPQEYFVCMESGQSLDFKTLEAVISYLRS